MEQSKRFNSVELFESCDKSILIATDIAARGLDITNVEHIIHYDTPRSRDVYVHRCGRTARIGASGVSILLCSPAEYHLLETKSLIPSKSMNILPSVVRQHALT